MSFQAYLDSVRAKTGLGPEEFRAAAAKRGLLEPGVKAQQVIDWLKDDYDLGRGHAMAILSTFQGQPAAADLFEKQFSGAKARWRPVFESLLVTLGDFGPVSTAPTATYISLVKGTGKFGIVAVTADRLDVGIKLKGAEATDRFEESGSWNAMVTHRVRITDAAQLDAEVIDWLRRAYEAA
jgi:hypothetical protein